MDSSDFHRILTKIEVQINPQEKIKCLCTRSYSSSYSQRYCLDDNNGSYAGSNHSEESVDHRNDEDINLLLKSQTLDAAEHEEESIAKSDKENIEYFIIDESETMSALGLPTQFGSNKRKNKNRRLRNRIGKNDFAKLVFSNCEETCLIRTLDNADNILKRLGYFYETPTAAVATQTEATEISNDLSKTEEQISVDDPKIKQDVSGDINEEFRSAEEEDLSSKQESSGVVLKLKDILDDTQNDATPDKDSSDYNTCQSNIEDNAFGDGARTKKKIRIRKKKNNAMPEEIMADKTLRKYYARRYELFSLFDNGIRMDRESWFSITPEQIAIHTANRLKCDIIIDAFCGAGGNTIQFAKTCKKVFAIDIDPNKVEMAKHNAKIYGVSDNIEFIVGDFLQLAKTLRADIVFLSPPWGGPGYKDSDTYDLETSLQPASVSELHKLCTGITKNIVMYLPKNSNTQQLIRLAGVGGKVELEQNYCADRLQALTAYYGDLIVEQIVD